MSDEDDREPTVDETVPNDAQHACGIRNKDKDNPLPPRIVWGKPLPYDRVHT